MATTEKAPAGGRVKNTEPRIVVLSFKDTDSPRGTRRVVCVPTKETEISAKDLAAIERNPSARAQLGRLERV